MKHFDGMASRQDIIERTGVSKYANDRGINELIKQKVIVKEKGTGSIARNVVLISTGNSFNIDLVDEQGRVILNHNMRVKIAKELKSTVPIELERVGKMFGILASTVKGIYYSHRER